MDRARVAHRAAKLLQRLRRTPAAPAAAIGSARAPSAEDALSLHASLVRRLRSAYGHPDEVFEQHLGQPIASLAGWLHRLPGPPGGGFERPGGALEQALTNCLFTLRAADGLTFEALRMEVTPVDAHQRWRLACALAGLFASLPDVLTRVEVASDDGRLWPAAALPLVAWLKTLAARKYRYRWIPKSIRSDGLAAVYAASRCITPEVMAFLASGGMHITAALMANLAKTDGSPDPISEIVGRIAAAVAAHQHLGAAATPTDRLTATIRRLFATSDWLPNAPGGHVWYARDGLYVLWPLAAAKLLQELPRTGSVGGSPDSADRLLNNLAEAGIVDIEPSTLRKIQLPGHSRPECAVRVRDHRQVLPERALRIAPLDCNIAASDAGAADIGGAEPSLRDAASEDRFAAPAQMRPADPTKAPEVAGPALTRADAEPLALDTSRVMNPRTRELIDAVVARLEHSFDKMLAKKAPGGIFVALSEFVGDHGDAAAIVRALQEAELVTCSGSTPRRVTIERMEGAEVSGVVLRAEAFDGYGQWLARWHAGAVDDMADR